METTRSSQLSQPESVKFDSSTRYMVDTRKHYLLASNTDSLESLLKNQSEQLLKVLIELKSEYDLILRESTVKKHLIEEYTKKINMLQKANSNLEKKQEEQKELSDNIREGIEKKKNKKNEELYSKQTFEKHVDKLSKDLLLIQKNIIRCESQSDLLDKKKERLLFDENHIKLRKNQIQFKIDEQNKLNMKNKNENDLQIEFYETVIKQKSMFMQLSDDKKERQKKIEQEAKIDSNDKQEVEKRRKLMLLMLYNQYLKQRMVKQLKKYEEIEFTFEKIRDIVGTQDLSIIINFVLERNKRYNYNLNIVDEKQKKIDKLKKDIKKLKTKLTSLKNDIIVNENIKEDSKLERSIQEHNGLDKNDIELIKIENEKNQELNILGKKYNEVSLSYNQVLTNIKAMQDFDKAHPLDIGEEEEEKKEKNEIKNSSHLTKDEEINIQKYEHLLKKILKVFNILYLCKTKQEFINLMKEKGISQYETINISDNKNTMRNNKKNRTRRNTRRSSVKINTKTINKKTTDEEDDLSNNDQDKYIMKKFINEQKKEIDDFIKIKKVEIKNNPNNK